MRRMSRTPSTSSRSVSWILNRLVYRHTLSNYVHCDCVMRNRRIVVLIGYVPNASGRFLSEVTSDIAFEDLLRVRISSQDHFIEGTFTYFELNVQRCHWVKTIGLHRRNVVNCSTEHSLLCIVELSGIKKLILLLLYLLFEFFFVVGFEFLDRFSE